MSSLLFSTLLGFSTLGQKSQESSLEHRFNFRMGASSATTNGQPTLCLEGSFSNRWSVESCGTGYGFVHQDPGIDFVHVRGKLSLFNQTVGGSQVRGSVGAGFAEVQTAGDELGFQFSSAKNGVETSGPEISGSAMWLIPVGERSEFILDANAGAAYFHYGPELTLPQPKFFPFVEISAGFGW